MKTVITVVGARPEFTKAAPVSQALAAAGVREILVHTGQHYDENMSDVFFDELGIDPPDYNLGAGSASHGRQTAEMLTGVENTILEVEPDAVVVYGDTNSTLAGALAAAKLHVPVAHIEAGLRSFNMKMPEEVNRRLTDHISTLLFCSSDVGVGHLEREGITEGVHVVGDVMLDAVQLLTPDAEGRRERLERLGVTAPFALTTVHRAENTDDPVRLQQIIDGLNEVSEQMPVVFPIHPRTASLLPSEAFGPGVTLIDPVGYLDALSLAADAELGLTDSGGLQKELYWLKTPCVTMRDETEWVETVDVGWNILTGADRQAIVDAARTPPPAEHPDLYGDGTACAKIASVIADHGGAR